MRVLFICGQNQHRSNTAEEIFRHHFETKSAGLWNRQPVTAAQLRWTEVVMVMEDEHRIELVKRFPALCMQKKLLSLGIPDIYRFMQPELIEVLRRKVAEIEL